LYLDIKHDIVTTMSVIDKIIKKFLFDELVTYKDAEKLLLSLGFELQVTGSHHIFRKKGYVRNASIKKQKLCYLIR